MTTALPAPAATGPRPAAALDWLVVPSPIGELALAGDERALTRIYLPGAPRPPAPAPPSPAPAPLLQAAGQLAEYFAGGRRTFELPLRLEGTPFQRAVWTTLATIGYGETISYAELAARVGRPRAFRAVGQANGANPVPIVLPCHRVIAADGTIGGYGGGLDAKRVLLGLEGVGWARLSRRAGPTASTWPRR